MSAERPYDIVLFGATGFTGCLTAEYLANHAPL
jgi:saccharopine dehydrogenase (NAD+, L-glutamate forming)